jgi:hypothetical protein
MVGDGGMGCRPGSSRSWPVVECGEADAEENEQRTYQGASWPASATPSITALVLRYQPSDVGSANPTASETGRTSSSGTRGGGKGGNGGGGGGLSTGATAAIATVIPLVFIIGALAAFLLWRRKSRNRKAAFFASKDLGDKKAGRPSVSSTQHPTSDHKGSSTAAAITYPYTTTGTTHQTPEWNIEMDATEAERQKLVGAYQAPMSASTTAGGSEAAAELRGMARVSRKPIAPVEIDSTEVRAEIGDAYIPYRPGAGGR